MGRPKAWLPFGDELLLPRIVRIVASVVHPVVVVAAPGQELPPLPAEIEIVRDVQECRGPLAGLARGLVALGDRVDAVYLSSCDAPFLNAEFIRIVLDSLGTNTIAVPRIGGYSHPLAGVYRDMVLPAVERMLVENRLRLRDLLDVVPTHFLDADAFADLDSLINVNSPDEYEAALRKLPG